MFNARGRVTVRILKSGIPCWAGGIILEQAEFGYFEERTRNMELIIQHSINRATSEATKLWSFSSAQYPLLGGAHIQRSIEAEIIEASSVFALNARRPLETIKGKPCFALTNVFWLWEPKCRGEKVNDLWEALNRIIHAQRLTVGFEAVPTSIERISGGAVCVPYLLARTDQRPTAFIDLFALSYAYLFEVLPMLAQEFDAENI